MFKRFTAALMAAVLALALVPGAAFAEAGGALSVAAVGAQSDDRADVVVPTYMKAGFDSLALDVGESFKLMPSYAPAGVDENLVTYSSANTTVATVDGDGTMHAVSVGEAVITAENQGAKATCKLTVTEPASSVAKIGDTEYTSLEAALSSAQADDVVDLLKTYDGKDSASDLILPSKVTLDCHERLIKLGAKRTIQVPESTVEAKLLNANVYAPVSANGLVIDGELRLSQSCEFLGGEPSVQAIVVGSDADHDGVLGTLRDASTVGFRTGVRIGTHGKGEEMIGCSVLTSCVWSSSTQSWRSGSGLDLEYGQFGVVQNSNFINPGEAATNYGVHVLGSSGRVSEITGCTITTAGGSAVYSNYGTIKLTDGNYSSVSSWPIMGWNGGVVYVYGGRYKGAYGSSLVYGTAKYPYGKRMSAEPDADGWYTLVDAPDPQPTVSPGGTVDGGDVIGVGGTYFLKDASTGNVTIATEEPVTVVGRGTGRYLEYLTLDCVKPRTNLTISDLCVTNGYSSIIGFYGKGNKLTFDGTCVLDQLNFSPSNIHVDGDCELTVDAADDDATLYFYKYSQGAGIGGNQGEVNGKITINGGKIFGKGSKQGALIGGGTNCGGKGTPGDITINGGELNLMSISRAGCIGGSAGSSGASPGGDFYINGGCVNINVDYSGAAIGGGGYATGNDSDGGTMHYTGGSVRTFVDWNAVVSDDNYNLWADYGVPQEAGVYSEVITADIVKGATKTPAYLCKVDTSLVGGGAGPFKVVVDGVDTVYEGGLHRYYYVNELLQKGDQVPISDTTTNWVEFADADRDTNLYVYLTGEDHVIHVNGKALKATFNSAAVKTKQSDPAVEAFSLERDASLDEKASTGGASGGGSGGSGAGGGAAAKKAQKVTAPASLQVAAGSTASIGATCDNVGAALSYATSDAAVATVAADGTVTGIAPGTATVIVKAPETDAYAAAEAKVAVTVIAAEADEAVAGAVALIDAIGKVTASSGPAIEAAEAAYAALDDSQKALVSNRGALAAARAAFDALAAAGGEGGESQEGAGDPSGAGSGAEGDGSGGSGGSGDGSGGSAGQGGQPGDASAGQGTTQDGTAQAPAVGDSVKGAAVSASARADVKVTAKGAVTVTSVAAKPGASVTLNAVKVGGTSYKVTAIAAKALSGTKAKAVTIGPNVKKVGAGAFKNAKALAKLTIGKNVASVGKKALAGCTKLKTITVKSPKLKTKASEKGFLTGSSVKTVKLSGMTKAQKKAVKKALVKWSGKKNLVVK